MVNAVSIYIYTKYEYIMVYEWVYVFVNIL